MPAIKIVLRPKCGMKIYGLTDYSVILAYGKHLCPTRMDREVEEILEKKDV